MKSDRGAERAGIIGIAAQCRNRRIFQAIPEPLTAINAVRGGCSAEEFTFPRFGSSAWHKQETRPFSARSGSDKR
jgi:hypothetical protein